MRGALVYLAHPVSAPTREGIAANLLAAGRWLSWCMDTEPDVTFVAPWLAPLLIGIDDNNQIARARGLRDARLVASRCHGIILCGPTISSGMQEELDTVLSTGGWCADLTRLGLVDPPDWMEEYTAIQWGVDAWRSRDRGWAVTLA